MRAKDWKGVIALGVVTVLAMGLIWGTTVLTRTGQSDAPQQETVAAGVTEEMPVDGYKEIQKAVRRMAADRTVEGYEVTVSVQGYQGPILMTAYVDGSGSRLDRLEITEQQETENLGGKIVEADFLDQFSGITLPVHLARAEKAAVSADQNRQQAGPGSGTGSENGYDEMPVENVDSESVDSGETYPVNAEAENAETGETEAKAVETEAEAVGAAARNEAGGTEPSTGNTGREKTGEAETGTDRMEQAESGENMSDAQAALALDWSGLMDGTYEARARDYSNGFVDTLTMTVSGGKVTAFVWDATDAGGNTKRVLTGKGEYTMTENGLTWPQQADALAEQVIGRQSLEFLVPDQAGKTDAVAGVSISIAPFLELSRQCLIEAGAVPKTETDETASESEDHTATEEQIGSETEQTETASDIGSAETETSGTETGSQVDGISGATISSAAVTEGVNKVYEYLQDMLAQ